MEASEEEVRSKIGHEDGEKGEGHIETVESLRAKKGEGSAVQWDSIDEESDEGACLLRIPTPICAP